MGTWVVTPGQMALQVTALKYRTEPKSQEHTKAYHFATLRAMNEVALDALVTQ